MLYGFIAGKGYTPELCLVGLETEGSTNCEQLQLLNGPPESEDIFLKLFLSVIYNRRRASEARLDS